MLLAGAVGGCARMEPRVQILEIQDQTAAPNPDKARTALALPSQEILDYESSPEGTFAPDRFEFGRRDASVSASERIPLLATNQWPESRQPTERPVRFTRWQQR